jgi:arthrofactin-type cyclic lipopeptide synthetase C
LAIQLGFDNHAQLESYIRALQAVIDRHDILRTAVQWEGLSEPVQVVYRTARLPVEEVELETASGAAAEQLYAQYDPRRFRMDVRQAPLLRLYTAYDPAGGRWLAMMLLHHLAGDHTMLEVMQSEVQAHLLGQEAALPAPLPFRNLVAQTQMGVSRQEHEEFFRKILGEVEEPTAPFGLLDVQGDGAEVEAAGVQLDADLGRRIRANARRLGVSAASLCHLAWAQVLAKVSGREDVVFGTVLFGRMQGGAGADRVMGPFMNTLPMRINIAGQKAESGVRNTHALLADLMRHEHASLALAQRCSSVPAPAPLFTALLNYRHSPGAAKTPEAKASQAWQGIQTLRAEGRTNYPFVLSVDDLGKGFALTAQAPAAIGPMRICEYMRTALTGLIEALESVPEISLARLEVLPESERHQLLYGWNETKDAFPAEKCIHELFEQQAARTPGATAVAFEDDELSYSELNRRANRLAHFLRGLGVGPDERVALCVERGFEMVVALLAVLKAGGAYVPLDPAYPEERLRFLLEDSAPVALLTQGHLRELLAGLSPALPVLDLTAENSPWNELPETNLDPRGIGLTSSHLTYVIYTSGSTGVPKGVLVEHANLFNTLVATSSQLRLGSQDRIPFVSGQAFDISLFELLTVLTVGGTVEIWRHEQSLDVTRTVRSLQRITVLHAVPTLMREIVSAIESQQASTSVRLALTGGDAVPRALIEEMRHAFGEASVQVLYGPTETAILATDFDCSNSSGGLKNPPIGRPLANVRVYILDTNLEPVPVGVAGELYISGAGVARGYLNRPGLTAEKFVCDPFSSDPGARMYRTGDLGRRLADGNIEFVGRNDFQVKLRGYRIELGEIEARLAEYPAVREAAVIAREEAAGDKRLVAYYTLRNAEAPSTEQLRAHMLATLPEYMVPAAYVWLEKLPLTANGKLNRKALPAPEMDAYATRAYQPPEGETEIKLAQIWAEVLKIERVGRHDNFFDLGGHSLLAIRVVTQMRQTLNVALPIRDLFASSELADLARLLESPNPTDSQLAAQSRRSKRLPLSFTPLETELRGPRVAADEAVLIRSSSAGMPLFIVHEGTGSLNYIPALLRYIDEEISIYGLPPRPPECSPLQTMEEMAARMVLMIRSAQPRGPYRILGWSFGGMLAYEIATQLICADQQVAFIGLLDTRYPPGLKTKPPEAALTFDDKGQLLLMMRSIGSEEESHRTKLDRLQSSSSSLDFESFVQQCRALSILPRQFMGATSAQILNHLAFLYANNRAYKRYSAQQLPISIHLFRAQDDSEADPFLGWDQVVPVHLLKRIPISGDHLSSLEEPHVEKLGHILSELICIPKFETVRTCL